MIKFPDFLAAAKTLARGSLSGDAEAFQIYLRAFEKYDSFDDVPDSALRALIRNLEIVPADGYNTEMKERLLSIACEVEGARLEIRRHLDDQSLDPLVTRDYDTEEVYVERVISQYPNIPRVLAADLLFRAYRHVTEDFAWLDVSSATYREEAWTTDRIIKDVKHPNPVGVQIEVDKFTTMPGYRSNYSLAEFMAREGTWPVPIPVFDNAANLSEATGREIARFEALDGMHRLGFLIAMKNLGMPIKLVHQIILVIPAS